MPSTNTKTSIGKALLVVGVAIPVLLTAVAIIGLGAAALVVGDWSDMDGNVGEPDINDNGETNDA